MRTRDFPQSPITPGIVNVEIFKCLGKLHQRLAPGGAGSPDGVGGRGEGGKGVGKFLSLNIKKKNLKFQSFKVSKFQSYRDSKNKFNVFGRILIPYYQISISRFLEDTDAIFKIFRRILDGSSRCFWPRLFQFFKVSISEILKFQKKWFGVFLNYLRYPVI